MMKRLLSCVLAAAMLCPSYALADDVPWTPPVITPIQKGQAAPFTGILLTPEAVAQIVAQAKECPQRVKIEADRAREEQRIKDEKVLADANATAERDRKVLQAQLDSKDAETKTLAKRVDELESSKSLTWLWVSLGAVGGGLLVTGAFAIAGSSR